MLPALKTFHIVIYGFGVVGKSVWMLCRDLGLPVCVADDFGMEYYHDDVLVSRLGEISVCDKSVIIVCSAKLDNIKKMCEKIKLIYQETVDNKIFTVDSEIYSPKYSKYLKKNDIEFEQINFVKSLLKVADDARIKYYSAKQNNIAQNSRLIKSRDLDINIFRKLHQNSFGVGSSMILYPFFHVPIATESECKDFGFRNTIEWNLLNDNEYRKEYKIVCIFGNSTVYGVDINTEDTIPVLIEKNINKAASGVKYKVINCAHIGDTVADQLSLYIWLFSVIKPDIVISVNGIELANAYRCDKILVERHSMFYKSYEEKIFSDYCHNHYPLPNDLSLLSDLDEDCIVKNLFFRLKQFEKIVRSDNATFIACLQPMLCSKVHKTKSEIEKAKLDFESSMDSKMIFGKVEKIDSLRKKFIKYISFDKSGLKLFLDLNDFTSKSKRSIFSDWIHLTNVGSKIVSKNISKLIIEKC